MKGKSLIDKWINESLDVHHFEDSEKETGDMVIDRAIGLNIITEDLRKLFDKEANYPSYETLLNFKTEREKQLFKLAIKQLRSKILGE